MVILPVTSCSLSEIWSEPHLTFTVIKLHPRNKQEFSAETHSQYVHFYCAPPSCPNMWETIFLPVKYLEYSSVSKSNSLLELCYAVMQLDSGSDLLNVCPQRFAVSSWKCLLCLLLTQRPVSSGHVYWLRVPFTFMLIYIDMSNWGNTCYICFILTWHWFLLWGIIVNLAICRREGEIWYAR